MYDRRLILTVCDVVCALRRQAEMAVSSEEVGTPGGRRRGGRFDREASQFGAFRREWGLKLAKALAAAFSKSAQGYRLNLDAFASEAEWCEIGIQFVGLQCCTDAFTQQRSLYSRYAKAASHQAARLCLACTHSNSLQQHIPPRARLLWQRSFQTPFFSPCCVNLTAS